MRLRRKKYPIERIERIDLDGISDDALLLIYVPPRTSAEQADHITKSFAEHDVDVVILPNNYKVTQGSSTIVDDPCQLNNRCECVPGRIGLCAFCLSRMGNGRMTAEAAVAPIGSPK